MSEVGEAERDSLDALGEVVEAYLELSGCARAVVRA